MENLMLIVVGLVVLILAMYMIKWLFVGAAVLFGWASEQAFLGVAAYFVCWVMFFPFMLVICIIVGAIE